MITIFLFPGVCNSVGEDGGRLSSPPPANDTTARKIAAVTVAGLAGWGGSVLPGSISVGKTRGQCQAVSLTSVTRASHMTRLHHSFLHSFAHLILKPRTFQTQKLDLGARFQQDR